MPVIIAVLLLISLAMLFSSMNRYKTFRLLSRDERNKYQIIAKKMKSERTEEEQEYYLQTQESFFSLLIAKYSLLLAIVLIVIYRFYIILFK